MKTSKIGIILIVVGMAMVFAAAGLYAYYDKDDRQAGEISNQIVYKFQEKINPIPDSFEESKFVTISGYNISYIISIPSVEIELPVINEWSYDMLKAAPCVYSGTVEGNDLIIMGHSYKNHFRPIADMQMNDVVELKDQYGTVNSYRVTAIEILKEEEYDKLFQDEYDLTLFTCTADGMSRHIIRCNKFLR